MWAVLTDIDSYNFYNSQISSILVNYSSLKKVFISKWKMAQKDKYRVLNILCISCFCCITNLLFPMDYELSVRTQMYLYVMIQTIAYIGKFSCHCMTINTINLNHKLKLILHTLPNNQLRPPASITDTTVV